VDNVCLHLDNPLDDGFVSDGCVTCPWHGWRYDLRTGEHLTMFGRRKGLRTYPVRADGDTVLIDVDEGR
jgi:nitrite reductase (NADH) small subunit